MPRRVLIALVLIILSAFSQAVWAGEYDFAIPEAKKSPFEFGGRVEMRYVGHWLNQDSLRYKFNYYNNEPGPVINEYRPLVELQGAYKADKIQLYFLSHHAYLETYEDGEWNNDLYEGYLAYKPNANLTFELGKKSLVWGKGYAWNPAGFINRPKDPDDPELNLEGRTSISIDYIQSFSRGALNNLAFTALCLPVIDEWANSDMGQSRDINIAFKLYLLWMDTDLDFMFFDGPNQPQSYGFDFAKNLAENFEIHGELGWQRDVKKSVINSSGQSSSFREDQLSYMVGVRYLNSYDTTFIAEFYHNGQGYDANEIDDFFAFQNKAYENWLATGNDAVMEKADRASRPYYSQRNFGQNYFYLKISQKEPFDILYFNPWITTIVNLEDFSFNLQPGMSYTLMTNLVMNFRVGIPIGSKDTEFGEKQDTVRPEIWVRYYF